MRNKLLFTFLVIALSVALLPGVATAGTIYVGVEDTALPGGDKDYQDIILTVSGATLVGNFGWQPMVAPNYDGVPYFDGASYDGASMGVIDFALGTGGFTSNPASPNLVLATTQYWGSPTGGFDSSTHFTSNGTVGENVLIEVSAWSGDNSLGWYNLLTPGTVHSLSADTGGSVSFSPGGDFGLVFDSPGGTFNQTANSEQFAFFKTATSPDPVPEPVSMALMGTGLLSLGLIRWRTKK